MKLRSCRALLFFLGFSHALVPCRADAAPPEGARAVEVAIDLDAAAAAAAISTERLSQGLSAVTVDARLMHIAELHARRMAAADRLAHVLPGEESFAARLAEGGVAVAAAENVAAGPRTFADALALWRRSPGHAANLLRAGDVHVGLAVAYAPASRYGTYWSLVLAAGDAPAVEIDDVQVVWPRSGPAAH